MSAPADNAITSESVEKRGRDGNSGPSPTMDLDATVLMSSPLEGEEAPSPGERASERARGGERAGERACERAIDVEEGVAGPSAASGERAVEQPAGGTQPRGKKRVAQLDSSGSSPTLTGKRRPPARGVKKRLGPQASKKGGAVIKGAGLNVMSTGELAESMLSWAEELEELRLKSTNLQGGVKGKMRFRIEQIRSATSVMANRATIDTPLGEMREENLHLQRENERLRANNQELRQQLGKRMALDAGNIETIEGGLVKKWEEEIERMRELYRSLKEEFSAFQSVFKEWTERGDRVESTPRPRERGDREEFPSLPRLRERGNREESSSRPRGRMASGEELLEQREISTEWTKVIGGKRKDGDPRPGPVRAGEPRPGRPPDRVIAFNPPAVLIKSRKGDETYAQVLAKAKEKVSLRELEIDRTRVRKTATGGVLVEIYGNDTREKADRLANKLREELGSEMTVTRPERRKEILLKGFEESATAEEIKASLMEVGGGREGDYVVRNIRRFGDGTALVSVACPVEGASRIAGTGRLGIGWSEARVELMRQRPIQCYGCLAFGHWRAQCKGKDNSDLCYKCGKPGHGIKVCTAREFTCVPCREAGLPSEHRAGAARCGAAVRAGKRRIPGDTG